MSEDLNFVLKARREKLAQLESLGVPPFAYGFDVSHDAVRALQAMPVDAQDGPRVSVAGRIVAWRPHGKTIFGHVADTRSRIQVYFRRDELGDDLFAQLALYDIGDIVGVEGSLFRTRPGETVLVSAAAGATGLLAAQIARNMGCRVVGLAGGARKCRPLGGDLGVACAIELKDGDRV